MTLEEQLKVILKCYAAEHEITEQKSLAQVLVALQNLSDELDLDFPSATNDSFVIYDEELFPYDDCNHEGAITLEDGSVYCGNCNNFIIKP